MKLPIDLRRPSLRLALSCAATLAVGLLLPVRSPASQDGARAQERAARTQEREARRSARREERAARREDRSSSRQNAPGESDAGPSSPESSGAAAGRAQRECRVSIQAASGRITAGDTVTVSGALECPTGASAADRQIVIYRHEAGAGAKSFGIVGTATTTADGSYELTPGALDANTVFQARGGGRRARTIVKVAPVVMLNSPAAPAAQTSAAADRSRPQTRRTTFTGTVRPAEAGARVVLQIAFAASGERWRPVAFGRVASDGSYSITHTFRVPGGASVRTIVHAGRLNAAGISEAIPYEATQPQNPDLTIRTSANPLAYGQPVTISGVAAGAGNQPVELLSRTRRGGFVVVAESTTDAGGEYTFTQVPLQNAYYRVADATTRSTVLVESVAFALTTEGAPATVEAGQQLTFSGTLASAPQGQVVYLERGYAAGIGFHVVAVGTVDATSRYQIAYTFERAGASVMRIEVPGDGRRQASASAPFTIAVMASRAS